MVAVQIPGLVALQGAGVVDDPGVDRDGVAGADVVDLLVVARLDVPLEEAADVIDRLARRAVEDRLADARAVGAVDEVAGGERRVAGDPPGLVEGGPGDAADGAAGVGARRGRRASPNA